jgi:hypothetical protein
VREAKIASEPEALTAWLKNLGLEIAGETRRNRADLEGWRRDGAHWALWSRQRNSGALGWGLASAAVGLAVARRAGMRKAKVALARKLAVILHRMLVDDSPFDAAKAAAAA